MLIATAGHIDHGKTALVRALTGVETDRLPEEKKRGISIDLGFAHWHPAPDLTIGFVDVPGHERFVKNMLAGVSAVDVALLVVAADDGVMPQTLEHVEILDLLGVDHGFVAITKSDKVSSARLTDVRAEIAALLATTSLAQASFHEVSSVTGEGISALSKALIEAARQEPPAGSSHGFRLAIDRAFSISGAGTVVTGTVLSGQVETGAQVVLAPSGKTLRVRGLQNAGKNVQKAQTGQRCAVNLVGVDRDEISRGDWLISQEGPLPATRIAARIRHLSARDTPLRHNSFVHLHHGTTDMPARLLMPGRSVLLPGETARVILISEQPVVAAAGDRVILREPSGHGTLGGGRVIEPHGIPARRRSSLREQIWDAFEAPTPSAALAGLLAIPNHEVPLEEFARSFNLSRSEIAEILRASDAVVVGTTTRQALSRHTFETASADIIDHLKAFHSAEPRAQGIQQSVLDAQLTVPVSARARRSIYRTLIEQGRIVSAGGFLRMASHKAAVDNVRIQVWQSLLEAAGKFGALPFAISDLANAMRRPEPAVTDLIVEMRGNGDVWRLAENRFLLREHIYSFARLGEQLTALQPDQGFTAAEYRDHVGIGRNFVIQLLEFYDRVGVTLRKGDNRWVRDVWQQALGRAAQLERGMTPRAYLPPAPKGRGPHRRGF